MVALDQQKSNKQKNNLSLFDLIVAFLFPTLIGKSLIYYFGLNYSNSPGEGYGIGLIISILFTACMIGRFLWKYRNYED
jgi:hypothetical protein